MESNIKNNEKRMREIERERPFDFFQCEEWKQLIMKNILIRNANTLEHTPIPS
jgi:hypothetical protein